ncbi:hypothetical protein PFISCL1PPCAC_11791, partial [Pristionchus fissidentatus]
RLIPGRAAHTFSAAKFYRGLASSVIVFCSSFLTMKIQAIILVSITLLSAVSFNYVINIVELRDSETWSTSTKEESIEEA